MSSPELVSVIVPVFNGARFLAECLASLAAQDHPAVEVVVVDDGSTDGSAGIAERFGCGVRVVRRNHAGLGATRNAGIDEASGSLIGFCDADDWWKPHKAGVQVEYLGRHPESDVILCRRDTAFEPGTEAPPWLIRDQVYGDLDGVSSTSGLFRRTVFERVRYRTDIDAGTDFNLLVQARGAGFRIDVLDESLHVRRIHGANITNAWGTGITDMFDTVRGHLRRRR